MLFPHHSWLKHDHLSGICSTYQSPYITLTGNVGYQVTVQGIVVAIYSDVRFCLSALSKTLLTSAIMPAFTVFHHPELDGGGVCGVAPLVGRDRLHRRRDGV